MRVLLSMVCAVIIFGGVVTPVSAEGVDVGGEFSQALDDASAAEAMWRQKHEPVLERITMLRQAYLATFIDGWAAWQLAWPEKQYSREYKLDGRSIRVRLEAAHASWALLNGGRENALYVLAEHVVEEAGAGDAQLLADAWAGAPRARLDAVFTALQALGAPYRFGFAGPEAYDCSGLTRAVYADLELPHKAAYQFERLGRSSDFEEVGALVFFAGGSTAAGPYGISHVAIHLGAGIIVHAAGAAEGVVIDDLGAMRAPVGWSSPGGEEVV